MCHIQTILHPYSTPSQNNLNFEQIAELTERLWWFTLCRGLGRLKLNYYDYFCSPKMAISNDALPDYPSASSAQYYWKLLRQPAWGGQVRFAHVYSFLFANLVPETPACERQEKRNHTKPLWLIWKNVHYEKCTNLFYFIRTLLCCLSSCSVYRYLRRLRMVQNFRSNCFCFFFNRWNYSKTKDELKTVALGSWTRKCTL